MFKWLPFENREGFRIVEFKKLKLFLEGSGKHVVVRAGIVFRVRNFLLCASRIFVCRVSADELSFAAVVCSRMKKVAQFGKFRGIGGSEFFEESDVGLVDPCSIVELYHSYRACTDMCSFDNHLCPENVHVVTPSI